MGEIHSKSSASINLIEPNPATAESNEHLLGSNADTVAEPFDLASLTDDASALGGREAPESPVSAGADALTEHGEQTLSAPGPADPGEGGEGGDGGAVSPAAVTNADFMAALFRALPEGVSAAVCSKPGDPEEGPWPAHPAGQIDAQCPGHHNNYFNCFSLQLEADGSVKARKGNVAAFHVLVLDDVGTKVPAECLGDFKPTYEIETSPGNFQVGFALSTPVTNAVEATHLQDAVVAAGLCDPGASGLARWARLPVGVNGKSKHQGESGAPFRCRLVQWNPEARYTPQEIVDGLKLELASASDDDKVFVPKANENPVITALKDRELYKTPLGSGKHDVTCPWVREHTDALDAGTAYFEPDDQYPLGGFSCMHSHRDQYHVKDLIKYLDVHQTEARHKPVIRVVAGDMWRVVNAAERELANRGRHFQYGSLIASITTDPVSGDPSVVPTSVQALTKELSQAATWEKFDGRSKENVACDPPTRHISILYDAQGFRYLPPLAGLARQPYFREADGELITQAGYDKVSQRFGVFDPRQFVIPEPTHEAAVAALALLEELLAEFHFVAPTDKAAALAAMFTAVVRPSLDYAPAFHMRAPVMGSGKTFLCELIGAFAGPGGNLKVSYPTSSEEATKVILSLLMTSPAVIEFDDMDGDWTPHGTIKRMLTAEKITDRILGLSKTATVSTRTLFLASGNNVGPVRDLLRRVLTIHIDPRCSTPATLSYSTNPVEKVRKERGRYVAAVLTIIQAWRRADAPRADVSSIVTYSGAWSEYCRFPLMWLGHPDPATALLEQVKHDPDGDALKGLMTEWRNAFGETPTTIRKAVDVTEYGGKPDLRDAICEFPVIERGEINRSKLGWVLKRHANRIVDGFEFQRGEADGRTAWCVAPANKSGIAAKPPSPALPASFGTTAKTVAQAGAAY
jgi:hypothetical protein